eukprot:c18541_g1_i1 orf=230-1696(+)
MRRSIPSHEEIDRVHAHAISLLLQQPNPVAMERYYDKLVQSGRCPGLKVKEIGGEKGKGVFAERPFEMDELVLKEPMLVGAQHTHNKADALVCSFCFCYIGSIEFQIGRHLLSVVEQLHDDADSLAAHDDASEKANCGANDSKCKEDSRFARTLLPGIAKSLLHGDLSLPYSYLFELPPIVKCVGNCSDEFFCSQICAEAAWVSYHSLLCTGSATLCKNKVSLLKFKQHADETNDIFHVAAQVIAATILKASKSEGHASQKRKFNRPQAYADGIDLASLLQAWEPFSMGHKRVWWECVALPADLQSADEPEFRSQLKELAGESLSLLKGALFQEDYAPLFSLQVYGHIIGLFELNNLDLVVASPVESYFIYIDGLAPSEKAEAEKVIGPLLDALGDTYATPCNGTALFPIQSCINHSCCPNAKAFKRDEDKDGQAVLLATRPIVHGEEVTISYIDENSPWEVRKILLDDYGFVCHCNKCLEGSSISNN